MRTHDQNLCRSIQANSERLTTRRAISTWHTEAS